MRKTAVKALVFASLLTMIPVSVAYAGTKTEVENKRSASYNDTFQGEIGNYTVTGTTGTSAKSTTVVVNSDTTTRYLHVRTDAYNFVNDETEDSVNSTGNVAPGSSRTAIVSRKPGDANYKYVHTGTARRGTSVLDYLVDSYSYTANQRY